MNERLKALCSESHLAFRFAAAGLVLLLPVVVLCVLGLIFLWEQGWTLWFILLISLTAVPFLLLRPPSRPETERTHDAVQKDNSEFYLTGRSDWSAFDVGVWEDSLREIDRRGTKAESLKDLESDVLEQWKFVAASYANDDALLNFTLPEALLVLEVLSREYRGLVLRHFPATRRITMGRARRIYDSSKRWYGRYEYLHGGWRILRAVLNPVGGIASEVRSRAFNNLMGDVSTTARAGLQRALLEEVSQVAIDLYSGRLKISDEELQKHIDHTTSSVRDPELPPLRVALIGQVNSGKSTLLNELKHAYISEVDMLPCTTGPTAFRCELEDGRVLELVDSLGLDGGDLALQRNLQTATSADLILLLSAANQPAKDPEREFMESWRLHFQKNPDRLMPEVILVSTQNDRLRPSQEWEPPYNLDASISGKAKRMRDALDYLREVLQVTEDKPAVPIAIRPSGDAYNIDVLLELLSHFTQSARGAQLNRLRSEAQVASTSSARHLRGALSAGRWLGKPVRSELWRKLRRSK